MTSLAIFGAGTIGGGVANLLNARGLVSRLVIYDRNHDLQEAQRLDILHTGTPVTISTDPEEIAACDIVICTAGLPRNTSVKTRADLLHTNLPAAENCAEYLKGFSGILIVITNPMDIITYHLHTLTKIPRTRIIGFGGQLDSARFSFALHNRGVFEMGIILGEHGEHQVPVYSRLEAVIPNNTRQEILTGLRGASMEIIRGKGATEFGPAWHISELVRMILSDARSVVPCSCVLNGEYGISGCSLGVPAIIGREGICSIEEWALDPWEQQHMNEAGAFVSSLCNGLVRER
ncbi:MAG: lactate dehydrogenase [Methanospirillum sp.]|uniref:malate dehydrogenase n=1 Tax=Methanospirillum sp. TaxID=45200 RepID=UPI00236BD9B8|nr:lactate dehydrogenase [Methanospirillum sp.]MDD1728316.1 lactate dehydrogenase [Methanospirillum sp.]